jgi:SEFIR domain
MLDLIAQVTLELNKPVPDSRAELYGSAILELLNRSHQDGDLESWGTKYEPFMRALAMASVQANPNQDSQLETELDWDTVEQALETARIPEAQHMPFLERLQRSGLVVRVGNKAIPKRRFIHLTLHEYALASAWLFGLRNPKPIQANVLSARLQNKLLEHWWQPNFESTLSLALSIASKHGANLHDPIMAMLASWERGKPSALRTALHLVNSANVVDEKVIDDLLRILRGFDLGMVVATSDHESPSKILAVLATDEDWLVRMMVAMNSNTLISTLHTLTTDENNLVLTGVGGNRNTSPHDLEILVRHKSRGVRWSVASNPNLLTSGEQYLMEEVRMEAELRPKSNALSEETPVVVQALLTKEQNDRIARRSAARDKNASRELLLEFSKDTDSFIRRKVAQNPTTPISAITTLANDEDREVRGGVAANPSTPLEILNLLAVDQNQAVRNAVAQNPNYIPETHPSFPHLTRPSTERTVESKTNPRVFISYTHDSPEHDQRILEFSKTLRTKDIDAQIDQYQQNPEGGWPTWMSKQLQQADFIIMVFTQTYKRRFDNAEEPGKGLGGVWEGAVIIKNDLYARHGWDKKFIPVIFESSDQQFIPLEFQHVTRHELPRDLEKLVDYVRGHNPNAAPPLGSPTSD